MTATKGTEPIGPDSVQTTLGETADPQGQWTRLTVLGCGGSEVIGAELLGVDIEGLLQPIQKMFRAVFYMKKSLSAAAPFPLCSQCHT